MHTPRQRGSDGANSGSNASSLDAEAWIQLHSQIALLSSRSAEVAVELVFSAAQKQDNWQQFLAGWKTSGVSMDCVCILTIHTYLCVYKAEH